MHNFVQRQHHLLLYTTNMKKVAIFITLITILTNAYSQNEFQIQLYSLNEKLLSLEQNYLRTKSYDFQYQEKELDLIIQFHRLSEEAQESAMKGFIAKEIGSLITTVTDLGCIRLQLLNAHLRNYNQSLYLENFIKIKWIKN